MAGRCGSTNQAGEPCSAQPLPGRDWCIWHDPDRAADRDEARRRGGRNSSREARARKLLAKGLEDLGDLQDLLMLCILDVLAGRLEPKQAHAVANLAGRIKDLAIGVELEAQVAEQTRQIVALRDRVG